MPHDSAILVMLAAGFAAALLMGLLATRMKLPPIVGYLLAGVAIGPFTPGLVADAKVARELAEVGVILLMFGVGLHFSFRDLWAVRAIAVPGAIAQIAIATALGLAAATWWGWPLASGLVFGLALSVASTVVLIRALQDQGQLDTEQGRIAVGWLVVEDLAMVAALVALPALAGSGEGLGTALAWTFGKAAAFAGAMLVVGVRVLPWLLARVSATGSRELFTAAVLATSLGVAYAAASMFDVSVALGAFFAGAVLGGSPQRREVAREALPMQDAFAILFFVSVGMLFDPAVLWESPGALLATLAIVVVGKSLAAAALVSLRRYPLGIALVVAASLAQIGEFSFILGELGLALGLLSEEALNLILGAAIVSIGLNPFLFRLVARWSGSAPPPPAVTFAPDDPVPARLPPPG